MMRDEESQFELHIADLILKFLDGIEEAVPGHGDCPRSGLQGATNALAKQIIREVADHVRRTQTRWP